MRQLPVTRLFFIAVFFAVSCKTTYQPQSVQYADYRINQPPKESNELDVLLRPYSDSVNRTMNDIVAVAGMMLEKKQPEGTLNNVLADAMIIIAKEKYQTSVDAAFINYGGIRLPSIPAGNITRGKIYELAPFDNIIVLQKLNGKVLQQFLNHMAGKGGWPCSGISYQIKNKEAFNILINGEPLEPDVIYTIALLDYIANGGDECDMLRGIPQDNNGYLFRDGVLEYFGRLNKQGKQVTASIEKRITNAN